MHHVAVIVRYLIHFTTSHAGPLLFHIYYNYFPAGEHKVFLQSLVEHTMQTKFAEISFFLAINHVVFNIPMNKGNKI